MIKNSMCTDLKFSRFWKFILLTFALWYVPMSMCFDTTKWDITVCLWYHHVYLYTSKCKITMLIDISSCVFDILTKWKWYDYGICYISVRYQLVWYHYVYMISPNYLISRVSWLSVMHLCICDMTTCIWYHCMYMYITTTILPNECSVVHRYAQLIAHYPYVIVVSILCLAVVCLVLCVTVVELPNFQDPKAVSA